MRDNGYALTVGEFRPGITGISAPIFNRSGNVLGSVGLALESRQVDNSSRPEICAKVVETGKKITALVNEAGQLMDLSPRAIG